MVFTYEIRGDYIVYVGIDKYENEELIKCALPQDIWFHVDSESSAHVYLRLKDKDTLDTIPEDTLEDCCQLVKSRSIKGCKLHDVVIVYTPASNLKKTNGMDVGQVGFFNEKLRKYKKITKENVVVNRIEKTKKEKTLEEHKKDWTDYQAELKRKRAKEYEEKKKEIEDTRRSKEEQRLLSYSDVMVNENMTSNDQVEDEDDFM
ncbi:coiled-coil domain containing protein, putative [Entamoeba invadens IP1]|uniref:Coiled-coil domain containing protein, putative n=1 Tax=Entamoeba invadens IP1 TaxID=370355 RepID=A0A0A1U4U0_ENTIV|nr:coiled-coil domain containing protein, putative [Entamoeba invadens IP1]ELP87903.1 coiled-coil domain containing protein, putative [Entamoeba invadens IP1]|eukprot:XP_004254674.1 coiled-coil domain containing protein, putative [Entamoeba invadens IP1]